GAARLEQRANPLLMSLRLAEMPTERVGKRRVAREVGRVTQLGQRLLLDAVRIGEVLRQQIHPVAPTRGPSFATRFGGDAPVMARARGPRPIWSGSITFGLVNVPVRVFTAVHEHKLSFHLVHEPDDGPIGYEKICKLEDKPVSNDEIVKAFEVAKGEFVHVEDADFEAAQVEGQHTIELDDFVPYDKSDPTFFAHTYLVAPQDGAEHAYALLARAMEKSGLAGIGKFVMRNRQYLGCLRVRDGAITLEQMYFADE